MQNSPTDQSFKANGLATLIGSLPLESHEEALDLIFEYTPSLPLWPQLPSRPQERMLVQFIEGFAGIVQKEDKWYFDTEAESFQAELLAFFEEYLKVSESGQNLLPSRFQISRGRAPGLYLLVEKAAEDKSVLAVKGQTTGPFTLLVGLTDQHQRLAYYDETLREMVVKGTAMKAAWQTEFLKSSGKPVILFLDEPALAGIGSSSFISIDRADIAQHLSEVIAAVRRAGGLVGIHVCANTDWPMLLSLDLDIINFDAYGYFDRFITCRENIQQYMRKGGVIAWGGIPTSNREIIEKENGPSLAALWEQQMGQLLAPDLTLKDLLIQCLITPSCGTGSIAQEPAIRVLELCRDVSVTLRNKYL
jgi:hypothetical protein